ncbi:MAG: cytidylate kinase-like family protein [Dehalococcoidia bacterium]|uniref:cytidylate kinase-like family protein n=1 Tax=Candidatus Amarobacter glycogenicus TaxID=3140699 RepID=UPI001D675856|nr:cytidylate kinase-like family protein [Dehalococcoidia bacterium]MBK6562767.1 cytidylate kinase-like family protein [Dehalococcoidia bacterium]MBK7126440.1 cytidylate kinase-like family protein [Dehalococcoidia bacterium]MBK7725480.1 cytidylate kinase-like family protein [Dehalococcoidia bacterium]MBK8560945.1 cytidylate kinase-like family protein [Dehalococcoidia bacterium]
METRVIAISRQVGTLGEDVARLVSEELNFRLLDYRVVQAAAEEAGVSTETIAESEHKPSFFTRILESLARNPAGPASGQWMEPIDMSGTPLLTSSDYRELVRQVVEDFARQGEVVFLGHGAQFILRDQPNVVRVLVTGTKKARARRVMAGMACNEEKATEVITRTDGERSRYFKDYFGADWLSPSVYDLCLNTDHLNPTQATRIILAAVHAREGTAAT